MTAPMRVVSLACSNTEITCALGCQEMLVGVDSHSDWPPEVVDGLPRVGPDLDIDIEAVVALEPDLVLATLTVPGHSRVLERLSRAGLPFVAPEPTSLDDVYRDILDIAERLGVPDRGERLVAEMKEELRNPAASGAPNRPTLLVQWWPKPVIVPGKESWTTDLIRAAGGRNPIGEEPVKSRPLTDGEVREIDPDAVVISWCGVDPAKYRTDVVLKNPAWAGLGFVREGRVYPVPEAYLGRPGPRLVEGLRALRKIVEEIEAVDS